MLRTIYLPKNQNFKKMVHLKVHGNLNNIGNVFIVEKINSVLKHHLCHHSGHQIRNYYHF